MPAGPPHLDDRSESRQTNTVAGGIESQTRRGGPANNIINPHHHHCEIVLPAAPPHRCAHRVAPVAVARQRDRPGNDVPGSALLSRLVPTDPYVPSDPDARPRQQQNLPPGVALPPAAHWRSDRPGDLGPAQPQGKLFGSPGPNVGFAYTLAQRAAGRFRLGAHEHLDDVVAVVAEVAGKRAASFGRAPVMVDVDRAAALLGYDSSAGDDFAAARSIFVHEAGHAYPRRRAIVDTVPEELLRATGADLDAMVASWRGAVVEQLGAHLSS